MTDGRNIIALVAGEDSGDELGAALMKALNARSAQDLSFIGVGGSKMTEQGLQSFFDMEEIAVMGFSAVIARLPNILKRIDQTARLLIEQKPDLLVIIDSPDFTHRVAKKVRAALPDLKIIDYVCPSVWAWRPGRAAKMTAYVDHVLAILPFEPKVLQELNGPEATYVGHPLSDTIVEPSTLSDEARLLLLPGSRSGEVKRLLPVFKQVLDLLHARLPHVSVTLVTLPKHLDTITAQVDGWATKPAVVVGDDAKKEAFDKADAALAASGTVCLELALAGVPMISTYKLDPVARQLRFLVTTWSANLPNLIVDYPIVPEYIDEFVRPPLLARSLERLLQDTPEREAQLAGLRDVQKHMVLQEKTPAEKAAEVVLSYLPDEVA